MPEGDSLRRTAAALWERIGNQQVRTARPPGLRRLVGQRVVAVEAVGKHLFIDFDSGLSLHTHLRMRGAWYVRRPLEAGRRPEHEIRVELGFDDWVALVYSAPVVELVADRERVAHLGPDILADAFDLEETIRRVRQDPSRAIGEAMLDQRICAGIGNIYKCESLWNEGVNPWTTVERLGEDSLQRLYVTARHLMRESTQGRHVARRTGVHGRGGRPCRRCSHLICVENQGNPPRLTYWCPQCQPSIKS